MFNRWGNYALALLVIYAMGWSIYLYGPLFRVDNSADLDEYYGKVIQIGRTSHVDIVHLRFNSNNIDFSLYLDEANIHYLNKNFDEHAHYRVITQKINNQRHLALAMEGEDFALNSQSIIDHMNRVRDYVMAFWFVAIMTIAHIFFMELKYYSKASSRRERS